MKQTVASYIETKVYEEFKIYANRTGKSASQLIRELVIATIEGRLKITPKEPAMYRELYNLEG